jgi:hypothetical protein
MEQKSSDTRLLGLRAKIWKKEEEFGKEKQESE